MEKYVEICGTPIEIKSIKDYRIVKKEYIYRPVFREIPPKNFLFSVKYVFETMEPYAAILDEKNVGILRPKTKKYECENAAGRRMWLALDEVPVLVHQDDGHTAEVFKDNPNYAIMEKDKTANIEMIEALVIQAKEKYIFYGMNIHLYSVLDAYNKVKEAIASLNRKDKKEKKEAIQEVKAEEKKEEKINPGFDVGGYAKNLFGKVKNKVDDVMDSIEDKVDSLSEKKKSNEEIETEQIQNNSDKTGEELRILKNKYESGEITIEEFNAAVNKLLDKL